MIGLQVCCLEAPLTDANIFAGIQQGTNIVLVQGRCQREADNLSGCLIHIIVQRAEKNYTLLTNMSHGCQEGGGCRIDAFCHLAEKCHLVILLGPPALFQADICLDDIFLAVSNKLKYYD